jgi:hypothetical protein
MSSFIIESPIFQEAQIIKNDPGKAIFRCAIQTVDEVNQNHRLYPKSVISEGIEACRSRMLRRAFLGELDHPIPTGEEKCDVIRQTTVLLANVSHIIRDYEFRGNHLVSEIETSSTPNGKILLGLLRDKSGVGFSMRGLAELERGNEYNTVKGPLTIVSYDSVSFPSHESAVVDFNEMKFESGVLTEQSGLVCLNGRCYLPNYFDKLVETKLIEFFDKWV